MTEIKRGDVFTTPNGPIQVKGIQTNGDLIVTDPTVHAPIDSRASTWTVNPRLLEESIEEIKRGRIEVES